MPSASVSARLSAEPAASSSTSRSTRKAPRSRSARAYRAHRRMVQALKLLGTPGPVLPESVSQRPGDRVVAGAARPLAQRGEPARAEVDRVEGQQIGGHGLARPLEVVALRVQPGLGGGLDRARGVEVDAHVAGLGGDLGGVAANAI